MSNFSSDPRDPTPGELRIMFGNIMESLRDVRDQMATKEFVNTKFDAYNDRVKRLEDDLKDWTKTSTEAHVKLEADSKARHELAESDSVARNVQVNTRIDKIEANQREQETTLKNQRNSRAVSITITVLGSILAIVGSIVATGITRSLFP